MIVKSRLEVPKEKKISHWVTLRTTALLLLIIYQLHYSWYSGQRVKKGWCCLVCLQLGEFIFLDLFFLHTILQMISALFAFSWYIIIIVLFTITFTIWSTLLLQYDLHVLVNLLPYKNYIWYRLPMNEDGRQADCSLLWYFFSLFLKFFFSIILILTFL